MAEGNEHINYELITKFLAGEANADEVAQVNSWRHASEANSYAFAEMETLWKQSTRATSHNKVEVDVEKGWQKLNARIEAEKEDKSAIPEAKTKNLYYYLARIAAVLVVGMGLYWLYDSVNPSENVVLATSDHVLNDTLPDGSTISLNLHSQLIYESSFGDQNRRVTLIGEGYFNVQHDAQRPFVIEAHNATVTVLGTSFYVRAYDSLANVTVGVKEGTVKVITREMEQIIQAGETIVIDKASQELQTVEPFDPNILFWETETLIFQNERLEVVFETLRRNYNAVFVVEHNPILDCSLTARFYGEDIDQILEGISASFNLLIVKDNNRYIISGSGCE